MTPGEFTALGRLLFGSTWKSDLARELGRHRTTIHKWANTQGELPEAAARHVRLLAESRGKQLSTPTPTPESIT